MSRAWIRWMSACGLALGLTVMPSVRAEEAPQQGAGALSADTRQKLMESLARGAQYLRQNQQPEGIWEKNPGITALAVTSLLRQTGVDHAKSVPEVTKALDYLEGLAKPDGGIYEKDIPHYITAVSMMALVAGGRAGDKPLIERAGSISPNLLDESEGVDPNDKFYGGMGYGGTSDGGRADIISLEYGCAR